MHSIPPFYGVYLLQSEPKPKSFYIGSSPDLLRRLRQHNRDLKSGGAYRTGKSGLRPWHVLAAVHGFPSKVSALQFEHALQHPHLSRHLRDHRVLPKVPGRPSSKINGISIHHRFAAIRLLVASRYFSRMQLQVVLFDIDALNGPWKLNKFAVATDVTAQYSDFAQFTTSPSISTSQLQTLESTPEPQLPHSHLEWLNASKARILELSFVCRICDNTINYFPDEPVHGSYAPLSFLCQLCPNVTHLACLASQLTAATEIIPVMAKCPLCSFTCDWVLVARIATLLRQYVTAGSEPETT